MNEYHECIEIDAAPETVWTILSDVERWPEWAPTFNRVARVSAIGGLGAVYRIDQPRLPVAYMTVEEWRPGRGFTWSSRKPLLRACGLHVIEPAGSGACRVCLGFRFEGAMALPVWLFVRKLVREYLSCEARSLKQRAEAA